MVLGVQVLLFQVMYSTVVTYIACHTDTLQRNTNVSQQQIQKQSTVKVLFYLGNNINLA